MNQYEHEIESGMALLALFSPSQVYAISRAVSAHGMDLPLAVEKFQVAASYPNNPLGALDPTVLGPEKIKAIGRTMGLIWKDALVTKWTDAERQKMLTQSMGVSSQSAAWILKDVETNDDAGLVRWLATAPILSQVTLGLLPKAAQAIDDAIDWWTKNDTGDNLYEFYRLGLAVEQAVIRANMMKLEKKSELEGSATIDAAELRQVLLPDTISGLVQDVVAIRNAMSTGTVAETGEPYAMEDAQQDLGEKTALIQEGLELLSRREHPSAEQNGWLGDALNFVGKAAAGVGKAVGKGVRRLTSRRKKRRKSRKGNSAGISHLARTVRSARGTSIPASVGDLEVIITSR
jgi:hypothetical protein